MLHFSFLIARKIIFLGLVFSLTLLFLTACGGNAEVSLSAKLNSTPNPSPTPLGTATPYPTYTPLPTYTPFPTATSAPTATPVPTPTPVPNPTKLLIGTNSDYWGEILRYQPALANGKLEAVTLSPELRKSLAEWFKDAQNLAFLNNNLGSDKNKFILKLDANFVQRLLLDSSPELNAPVTMSGGFYGSNTRLSIGWSSNLQNMLPLTLLRVIMQINFSLYSDFDSQLISLREDVNRLQDFLENQELSKVRGTLEYLQNMQTIVSKQQLQPQDAQAFRNQLEEIEKNSLQGLEFARLQMENAQKRFKEINLDKKLFVFRNEEALDKLQVEITEFRRYSYNYLVALTARGLSAQLRCILPGSKDIAAQLLESSRQKLTDWTKAQKDFYATVESRVKEMDGWFADSKKPKEFVEAAKKGRETGDTKSTELDKVFASSLSQVQNYAKFAANGLDLVIELSDTGEIKQVYRLVKS